VVLAVIRPETVGTTVVALVFGNCIICQADKMYTELAAAMETSGLVSGLIRKIALFESSLILATEIIGVRHSYSSSFCRVF
jgi:hypothetical protein